MFRIGRQRRVSELAVVLLPQRSSGQGAFASWEIWAPVFERLSPHWRVVTFDQGGVGQTKVT